MSSSHLGQGSLDAFVRSGVAAIAEKPPQLLSNSHSRSPMKRPRVDSDPESDEEEETNTDRMDFQQAEDTTATHAIGDDADDTPQLAPPLNSQHAALRSDFEIITMTAMEQLYRRITADIEKSAADTATALRKANDQVCNQVATLGTRITQLQTQLLTYQQHPPQPPAKTPVATPAKNVLKLQLTKKNASKHVAEPTTPTAMDTTPPALSSAPQNPPANVRGWETVQTGAKKMKTPATPKLIPTKYPQTEREVTCHFQNGDTGGTNGTQPEKTYSERQIIADVALRHVNSAIVDNKDVFAPPFIRARVTTRGNIIFTTSNTQSNVIYEDYTTIIADALSYYGPCEKVEIGKRFSQFLLHGVPTHISLPEISHSLTANYPQLIQGQTPRWLTPADRREHKANSTIVMTLTGDVKKAAIGRQHLIVCNRECQLDDYIAYGRSTQCRNCQGYGHPAALCRNTSHCAVCAEPHDTREHPCTLPICKKGPACTHPPIHCANCDAPHKASDPNCPERIKLRNITKTNTNTTNQGDAPMAGVAN